MEVWLCAVQKRGNESSREESGYSRIQRIPCEAVHSSAPAPDNCFQLLRTKMSRYPINTPPYRQRVLADTQFIFATKPSCFFPRSKLILCLLFSLNTKQSQLQFSYSFQEHFARLKKEDFKERTSFKCSFSEDDLLVEEHPPVYNCLIVNSNRGAGVLLKRTPSDGRSGSSWSTSTCQSVATPAPRIASDRAMTALPKSADLG